MNKQTYVTIFFINSYKIIFELVAGTFKQRSSSTIISGTILLSDGSLKYFNSIVIA